MNKLILMRHAEKNNNGEITKKGMIEAFDLGKKFKAEGIKIQFIRTSPIERCKKTALEFVKGYNSNLEIIEDNYLGDPGVYIKDDKVAIKTFEKYSLIEVLNKQIENQELDGFENFITGSKKLESKISKEQYNNEKNILYISHDAIINPFISYLNKANTLNECEIVNFLEFFEIVIENNLIKEVKPKKSFF